MDKINRGVITFDSYKVKKVSFNINEEYNQEEVNIDLDITAPKDN